MDVFPLPVPPQNAAAPATGAVTLQQETDAEFAERVKPDLQGIEVIRKEKYDVYCWRRKIGAIVGAVLVPFTGFIDYILLFTDRIFNYGDKHGGGLTVALVGAIYWWVTQPKRQYASAYKQDILPRIAAALGLSSYQERGVIPPGDMTPSKILPHYDRYHSEDYFEGTYKGAAVRFAQIKLEEERGSGKNRHMETVFAGLALLVGMPRGKFQGQTVMVANHNKIMEWFEEKSLGMQKADLVDPVFEKKYTVYTTDQVEARYLLDPVMIERVQKLAEIYNATDVKVSYYYGRVLALLSCRRDLFEPPDISIPATDIDGMLELKREVERTLDLIDCIDSFLTRDDKSAPAPAAP